LPFTITAANGVYPPPPPPEQKKFEMETSSLTTLKIMPKILNEIVRS
jgi:hypothetical protein